MSSPGIEPATSKTSPIFQGEPQSWLKVQMKFDKIVFYYENCSTESSYYYYTVLQSMIPFTAEVIKYHTARWTNTCSELPQKHWSWCMFGTLFWRNIRFKVFWQVVWHVCKHDPVRCSNVIQKFVTNWQLGAHRVHTDHSTATQFGYVLAKQSIL